jgi:hypothetical protein
MSIPRRTFMSGLAAMLSVIRIPSVSASDEIDTPGIDINLIGYEYHPPVEYLHVGDCEDMRGGPASQPGWYLHPVCAVGCCNSEGPFPSREAAVEADTIRWDEIEISSRRRTNLERDAKELEPF